MCRAANCCPSEGSDFSPVQCQGDSACKCSGCRRHRLCASRCLTACLPAVGRANERELPEPPASEPDRRRLQNMNTTTTTTTTIDSNEQTTKQRLRIPKCGALGFRALAFALLLTLPLQLLLLTVRLLPSTLLLLLLELPLPLKLRLPPKLKPSANLTRD